MKEVFSVENAFFVGEGGFVLIAEFSSSNFYVNFPFSLETRKNWCVGIFKSVIDVNVFIIACDSHR